MNDPWLSIVIAVGFLLIGPFVLVAVYWLVRGYARVMTPILRKVWEWVE